jgi:hypothetical protein
MYSENLLTSGLKLLLVLDFSYIPTVLKTFQIDAESIHEVNQ